MARRLVCSAFLALSLAGCGGDPPRGRCWVVVEEPETWTPPWPHRWLHLQGRFVHGMTGAGETPGWLLQAPWVVWREFRDTPLAGGEGLGAMGEFAWATGGLVVYPLALAGRAVSYAGGGALGGAAAAVHGIFWDLPGGALRHRTERGSNPVTEGPN